MMNKYLPSCCVILFVTVFTNERCHAFPFIASLSSQHSKFLFYSTHQFFRIDPVRALSKGNENIEHIKKTSNKRRNYSGKEEELEEAGSILNQNFAFHSASLPTILKKLNITNPDEHCQRGLTSEEVNNRIKLYRLNTLRSSSRKTWVELFIKQFDDRLIQILLCVAGLSCLSSVTEIITSSLDDVDMVQTLVEPGIILLILVLNAIVGVIQQISALESMDSLAKLQPKLATVLRSKDSINGDIIDGLEGDHNTKGEWVPSFNVSHLVPGDLIKLKIGDMVPADVVIIKLDSTMFGVDESCLTGESSTVQKEPTDNGGVGNYGEDSARCLSYDIPLSCQRNMAFSGTLVTQGTAKALVVHTGGNTEMGKIQRGILNVEDDKTPLGIKLDKFGDDLALVIAIICAAVWIVSIPHFGDPSFLSVFDGALYYAKIGVALGVAAIPEGLPAVVTLVLSLGTRRLADCNVIVRKLPSVETLGCVSVICTDKTGTLTTNEMTAVSLVILEQTSNECVLVESVIDGTSYEPVGTVGNFNGNDMFNFSEGALADVIDVSFGCNDAQLIEKDGVFSIIGEPTEGALLCLGEKLRSARNEIDSKNVSTANLAWERCITLEFDRVRKSMSVLCKPNIESKQGHRIQNVSYRLLVKGAPNVLLERCSHIKTRDGTIIALTSDLRMDIEQTISSLSRRPLRCMLLAVKDFDSESDILSFQSWFSKPDKFADIESDLTFVGLVGMKDPPRPEAKKSIQTCKNAGIRIIMITGDSKETAVSVARELQIFDSNHESNNIAFNGKEFFSKPEREQLLLLSSGNVVFCRTEPVDKQKIVRLLQSMKEIPAMTGDGVNDAPALRQASIGIAMCSGSDVAKEASDMILIDDSFATIVNGVKEGRCIYSNIQAFIIFLISCNVGEVLSIFFATILGFPSILNAMQLLWVNLATDGPAATALGFNPVEKNVMEEKPRNVDDEILTPWLLTRCLVIGVYIGIATVGIFAFYYQSIGVSIDQLSHWSICDTWSDSNVESCDALFADNAIALPQTLALSALVTMELLKALSTISVDRSIMEVLPWSNPYLVLGVSVPFMLHLGLLYIPSLAHSFGLAPLSFDDWIAVLFWSLPVILIDEVLKAIGEHRLKLKH